MSQTPLIKRSTISFHTPFMAAILNKPLISTIQASYSSVLTMANFILFKHPQLQPPETNFQKLLLKENIIDSQYPQPHLTHNLLYEPWCDYLSEMFFNNKVIQNGDLIHFYDDVTDQFISKLDQDIFLVLPKSIEQLWQEEENLTTKNLDLSEQSIGILQRLKQQRYYSNKQKQQTKLIKKRKIAIMSFILLQPENNPFRPKIHLKGIQMAVLYNQYDEWSVYNILKGQFPSLFEFATFDTIVLPGSFLSVGHKNPQAERFRELLKQALILYPKLKIFSICFGHQFLASIFKGEIQFSRKPMSIGIKNIMLDHDKIKKIPYFKTVDQNTPLIQLTKYHEDHVVSLPQGFQSFAKSSEGEFDGLVSKHFKYLSLQFHPEHSAQYLQAWQRRCTRFGIQGCKTQYHSAVHQVQRHNQSIWKFRRIVRDFFDWVPEN